MDVGIGLPSTIPGAEPEQVLEAARRAEGAGFYSLGVLDRLAYANYEPMVTLGAVAAETERIHLTTAVINGPWRGNAALLAKQAATLDKLSGGRLTLGVGLGGRDDDYEVSGVSTSGRGKQMDALVDELRTQWNGGPVGPDAAQDGGPPLLIGGGVEATFERAARVGAGWIMGGGTPDQLAEGAEATRKAFKEAGRSEEPRIAALCYFGLGPNAEELAKEDLMHYYAWLGDEIAGMIAGSAATDEGTVAGYRDAFEQAGCDELIYFPTSADPGQVDLLADAVL